MGCSLPASSAHGIFQARILKWVAISSSRGSSQPRDRKCISCTGRWILYHCTTWGRQSAYRAEFHPIYSLASILTAPVHGNITHSNSFYPTCWTLSKSSFPLLLTLSYYVYSLSQELSCISLRMERVPGAGTMNCAS